MNIHFTKLTKTVILFITLMFICISQQSFATAKIKEQLPLTDIQRFTTVIEHIKNYYVTPQDDDKLFEYAIRGMLAGLDPHSVYLDEEEYNDLQVNTSGKFGGLGIEVTMEDGFIRVISPIDDTPAQKAGVKAGDIIIKLDETQVKGLTLRKAVDLMRGQPGTKIALMIIRGGEPKPLVINVTRAVISVQSVKGKLLDKKYAYIRVSQFQSDTGREMKDEINKLTQESSDKKLHGLILDLRNNPGGLVDTAVEISDAFLDRKKLKNDGLIVYTKGRTSTPQVSEKATNNDVLNGAPIIVLINGGSASASEIVAGALQDHKRAVIMGSKSFGKGSVQTVLPLKDKRGLKLTTALYYTPSGRSIQATGIEPDITINDLKISPDNQVKDLGLSYSEADLEGHLESKNNIPTKEEAGNSNNEKTPLVFSDYALYEALNLLKGLDKFN
jgi:carboxyl-terminal processing protease